jgi:hypothetical protein
MNRISIVVLGAVLAASYCYGQDSTTAPAQGAPAAIGHGAFPVKITKTLDSSKLKEGDAVEVETAGSFKLPDGTLVPKGSKLMGHVTVAKARSKGDSDSQLTVAFDKLNITNGKQLLIKGTVQAVFPPADEPMPEVPRASTSPGGSGLSGGAVGATPDYKPMTEIKNGADPSSNAKGQLTVDPKAVGVQGFDNLQLNNGVLSSKGKNVKLGGGVRMIVRADILG